MTVKLQDVNAPDPVKAAFSEVNGARQEKERMINQAQEAFKKEIPKATGQALEELSNTVRNKRYQSLREIGISFAKTIGHQIYPTCCPLLDFSS